MTDRSLAWRSALTALTVAAFILAGCARAAGAVGPVPSGTLDAQQDGVDLRVKVSPQSVAPGGDVTIDVTFTNLRNVALMYDSIGCFAQVQITAALPLDPTGRTWPGSAGAFKDYALSQGLGAGGVPATDPLVIEPQWGNCAGSADYQQALGRGADLETRLTWPADYLEGLPVVPQRVSIAVTVGYDLQNGPPSYPPDYSGVRGSWVATFNEIKVDAGLMVSGPTPKVVTAGQAIDAALTDSDFATYVAGVPVSSCNGNVNLYLTDNGGGGYLPAGPAWNVESICDTPRQFRIIAVDALTGEIKGAIRCDMPCNR